MIEQSKFFQKFFRSPFAIFTKNKALCVPTGRPECFSALCDLPEALVSKKDFEKFCGTTFSKIFPAIFDFLRDYWLRQSIFRVLKVTFDYILVTWD